MSSKLLIPSNPLIVLKELVLALNSVDKAIVVQQIHFLTQIQREAENWFVFRDDHFWVYNSYDQWKESHFPFWSIDKIGRLFRELEELGVIVSWKPDAHNGNHRKWYRVNAERLDEILATTQDDTTDTANLQNRICAGDTIMSETTASELEEVPSSNSGVEPPLPPEAAKETDSPEPSPLPESKPSSLAPETEAELRLFALINHQRSQKGWKLIEKFQNHAMRKKFRAAAVSLTIDQLDTAVTCAFTNIGTVALTRVVCYVSKWRPNGDTRRNSSRSGKSNAQKGGNGATQGGRQQPARSGQGYSGVSAKQRSQKLASLERTAPAENL